MYYYICMSIHMHTHRCTSMCMYMYTMYICNNTLYNALYILYMYIYYVYMCTIYIYM